MNSSENFGSERRAAIIASLVIEVITHSSIAVVVAIRIRQQRSKPIVEALKPWFEDNLARMSKGSKLAEGIAYGLNHWDGLCRFLEDGRIEIDSNTVERSIRGLALTRKNALFAGHDRGAAGWAMIASLLETCKLNSVDPLAWTTDVLTKLVNRWPASRIDELMPWAYAAKRP